MKKILKIWQGAGWIMRNVAMGAAILGLSVAAVTVPLAANAQVVTTTVNSTLGAVPTTPAQAIIIVPAILPNATVGVNYSQTLGVNTQATAPFYWSIFAGALPDGLTLVQMNDGSSANLSGTPITATTTTFTLSVTNHAVAAVQTYVLTVNTVAATTTTTTTTTTTNTTTSSLQTELSQLETALQTLLSEANMAGIVTTGGSGLGNTWSAAFYQDLTVGDTGPDVMVLQQFLNQHGYPIAQSGPGSLGNETQFFGELTEQALSRWQAAVGISPANGYFGPITRSYIAANGSSSGQSQS